MVTETSNGDGKLLKVERDALKGDREKLKCAADALNEEALNDNQEALRGMHLIKRFF